MTLFHIDKRDKKIFENFSKSKVFDDQLPQKSNFYGFQS